MATGTLEQTAVSVTPATQRRIRKAAVLGAGIMGARIACHFANIGVPVLLLDIVPRELTAEETAAGLTLQSPKVRNRPVNDLFNAAVKANPSPIYDKSYLNRISLGNFDDDMKKIAECDWIIEVVVERLDIKKIIYEQVEKYRKPGTLITSNTSGIPFHMLAEGRSADFQANFAGTHFFNPPRYLPLLEIIPAPQTSPEVVDFLMHYGDLYLGKKTVLCKDTPAFIANRVGIFAIADLFRLVDKYELSVEEVDKLSGPLIGHAKSATFRTMDLVGLDTSIKVAKGIKENCPNDERKEVFDLPAFVMYMEQNNLLGDKTGQGFFKKSKNEKGEKVILTFDLKTQQYREGKKVTSDLLDKLKNEDDVTKRIVAVHNATDKYGQFMRESAYGLFTYVSHRIPEIADELYRIDSALAAGFGWQYGPFETWDILGLVGTLAKMKSDGHKVAPWVDEMVAAGHTAFYKVINGRRNYYDIPSKSYKELPGGGSFIYLDDLRTSNVVWKNSGSSLFDLGDDVLLLEFHSKMNTMGAEVLEGLNKAIDKAEKGYRGLVVGNQGENFTLGANLVMVMMMASEQDWDELDFATRFFQNTNMRARHSSVPVVVAPHTMTLGGGCELSMHSDSVQAAAETYIGLVEVGVGLIPGGGGTKEMAMRMSDRWEDGDVELNILKKYFINIATAKVATSAAEAFDMDIFRQGQDRISVNKGRQLADAKARVLELSEAGYTQPLPRKDIRVIGKQGLGMVYAGAYQMRFAGYASEHDEKIAQKIGYILCGGDLSSPTMVTEQYLLDLEREAFLSLCGERKTLERIAHTLKTGKPLRN